MLKHSLSPPSRYKQQGVTLLELMIAGTISVIALAAILSIFSATAHHSKQQLQSLHLNSQLRSIMQLLVRDLRRAGYWQFNPERQSPALNPFQNDFNRIRTGSHPDERAGSCLLLAYDLDRDGLIGIGRCTGKTCDANTDDDNVEQFGYRLRKGSIQSRYGGNTLDCDSGSWQALNDPDTEIIKLNFLIYTDCINLINNLSPCDDQSPHITRHAVRVLLDAQLKHAPDINNKLERWVVIRNQELKAPTP